MLAWAAETGQQAPGGWDWLGWPGWAGLGVFFAVAFGLFQYLSWSLARRQYWQDELGRNPAKRAEYATGLRNATLGTRYRDTLAWGLDWLDRRMGEPASARALGVCFLVALVYAWAFFFIGWGFLGVSGTIGGFSFLADDATQPGRAIFAVLLVLLPLLAYWLGGRLGRWVDRRERRLKARLLGSWRRRRLRRRGFEIVYRGGLALLVFGLLLGIGISSWGLIIILLMGWGVLPTLGAVLVSIISRWNHLKNLASLVSFFTGTASSIGIYIILFLKPQLALFILMAITSAVFSLQISRMFNLILSLSILAFFALILTLINEIFYHISDRVVFTSELILFASIASLTNTQRHDLYAASIGTWVGFGIALGNINVFGFGTFVGPIVVILLFFFLVLPLANAVWDWLSWVASRWLGRHLLRTLADERGPWARTWAVAWHGLLDLAIAVALLLAMAWALAFGFALYDEIATWKEARSAFPELAAMVTSAAAAPFGAGFWLTAMLVTTLFPTLLHGLVLLASPLGLVFLPGKKRQDLAEMLELYDAANEGEQAAIRHEVAVWVTRGQLLAWLGGGLLGTYALLRLLALIAWLASATLVPGASNFATLVGAAAHAGIATAQGLGTVLLGNGRGGGDEHEGEKVP